MNDLRPSSCFPCMPYQEEKDRILKHSLSTATTTMNPPIYQHPSHHPFHIPKHPNFEPRLAPKPFKQYQPGKPLQLVINDKKRRSEHRDQGGSGASELSRRIRIGYSSERIRWWTLMVVLVEISCGMDRICYFSRWKWD